MAVATCSAVPPPHPIRSGNRPALGEVFLEAGVIGPRRIRPSYLAAIRLGVSLALVGALFVFLPVGELAAVVGKVPLQV